MTTPAAQVWPSLRATDAPALIHFLCTAFGFIEVVVYSEGDQVSHAQLAWPEGGGIMLGSAPSAPTDGDRFALTPGTFGAYVVTADPDALHDRAVAAGAQIAVGLHDTDYGSRDFACFDPEGNQWNFGSYPGEPAP